MKKARCEEIAQEEIKQMERYGEEMSDWNFQMQQAEDAMWRDAVKAHTENGIKPLMVF